MHKLRRTILAASLLAGLLSPLGVILAQAQAPPAVPALPDTERRTTYSLSGTTCACAVNFAIYGDSTDFQDWITVWVNGALQSSSTYTITSPTGPLATIPRPITDAVLTFTNATTGTVQIVGARRPRRTSQFQENRGVAARDLNQSLTDVIAVERELWDLTQGAAGGNGGRILQAPPGETFTLLPPAASRANGFLCFDATGLIPTICPLSGGAGVGNVVGASPTIVNNVAVWNGTGGTAIKDGGGYVGSLNSTPVVGNANLALAGAGGTAIAKSGGSYTITSLGYTSPTYIASGSPYTWVVPVGVTSISVDGTGGGSGSGAVGYASSCLVVGTPGYSGEAVFAKVLTVTPGDTLTITVGAAGTAGPTTGITTCVAGVNGTGGTIGGDTTIVDTTTSTTLLTLKGGIVGSSQSSQVSTAVPGFAHYEGNIGQAGFAWNITGPVGQGMYFAPIPFFPVVDVTTTGNFASSGAMYGNAFCLTGEPGVYFGQGGSSSVSINSTGSCVGAAGNGGAVIVHY